MPGETAGSLHDKLSILGANILKQTIEQIEHGGLKPIKQDHTKATYAPMLKTDGLIKWDKEADDIHNLVRGQILAWILYISKQETIKNT